MRDVLPPPLPDDPQVCVSASTAMGHVPECHQVRRGAFGARHADVATGRYQRPSADATLEHPPEEARSCSSPGLVPAGEGGAGAEFRAEPSRSGMPVLVRMEFLGWTACSGSSTRFQFGFEPLSGMGYEDHHLSHQIPSALRTSKCSINRVRRPVIARKEVRERRAGKLPRRWDLHLWDLPLKILPCAVKPLRMSQFVEWPLLNQFISFAHKTLEMAESAAWVVCGLCHVSSCRTSS